MANLTLHVKKIYFDQMESGEKKEEYRKKTPYWTKRLVGKTYDNLIIACGYPKKTDLEKYLVYKYTGYYEKTITHSHFGANPEEVFSIPLNPLENHDSSGNRSTTPPQMTGLANG